MIGDFLGFTLDNVHSSDLQIVRTTKGFTSDNLLPTLQDVSITIPKGQGSLYYGSTYTQRKFSLSFSFEGVTDDLISEWKVLFNNPKIQKLILDEEPYKSYRVKTSGVSTIKHLAFTNNNVRYYNGEGTITFICYFPYAISEYELLNDSLKNQPWAIASDIPVEDSDIVLFPSLDKPSGYLYNAGDTDLILSMNITKTGESDLEENKFLNMEIEFCIPNEDKQNFGLQNLPWENQFVTNESLVVDFFRGEIYDVDEHQQPKGNTYFTHMIGDYIYIPSKTLGYYTITSSNSNIQIKFNTQYLYI